MDRKHPAAPVEESQKTKRERRVNQLRSLPVGWAALGIILAGTAAAIVLTVNGVLDYGTAGFAAAVVLMGTLLGLAAWDLFVAVLETKLLKIAIPRKITLGVRPGVVPYLSPGAFAIGLLIGHQFWH
jgi:hypothetical protein